MQTLSLGGARAARSPRGFLAGLLAAFERVGIEVAAWRAERAMAGLDDHMLHDIGVTRGEIGYAVRHGRD